MKAKKAAAAKEKDPKTPVIEHIAVGRRYHPDPTPTTKAGQKLGGLGSPKKSDGYSI